MCVSVEIRASASAPSQVLFSFLIHLPSLLHPNSYTTLLLIRALIVRLQMNFSVDRALFVVFMFLAHLPSVCLRAGNLSMSSALANGDSGNRPVISLTLIFFLPPRN